jgi:vancomycin resistance protein VanW
LTKNFARVTYTPVEYIEISADQNPAD